MTDYNRDELTEAFYYLNSEAMRIMREKGLIYEGDAENTGLDEMINWLYDSVGDKFALRFPKLDIMSVIDKSLLKYSRLSRSRQGAAA